MILIELLQPHIHAGVLHIPGDILLVEDDSARWLIEQGIARVFEEPADDHTPTSQPGD